MPGSKEMGKVAGPSQEEAASLKQRPLAESRAVELPIE